MTSLLPADRIALKRLNASIKRVSTSTGILLIGVDTPKLADEFSQYLIEKSNLLTFDFDMEILSTLAYTDHHNKNDFFIANIYDNKNNKIIINHLQFQRDFIPAKHIKLILILSNDSLEYLKTEAGDLYSTVKFSHSFIDHSFKNNFKTNDEKLKKTIDEYDKYLKNDIRYNNIIFEMTSDIANEANSISSFKLALEYLTKSLDHTDNAKEKVAQVHSNMGTVYNSLGE